MSQTPLSREQVVGDLLDNTGLLKRLIETWTRELFSSQKLEVSSIVCNGCAEWLKDTVVVCGLVFFVGGFVRFGACFLFVLFSILVSIRLLMCSKLSPSML